MAARTGRKTSYAELLMDDCVERGLRHLQRLLQDDNVTDKDKWTAAQPLVVKRAKAEVEISSAGDIVLNIIKNSDEKTNVIDDAPVEETEPSV